MCCGSAAGVLRERCGCAAGVLRECCGCAAGVLRVCCGCAAGVLRVCCGCAAGVHLVCIWGASGVTNDFFLIFIATFYRVKTLLTMLRIRDPDLGVIQRMRLQLINIIHTL